MEKGLFGASPFFGDVALRVLHLENDVQDTFVLSPEQARALAKALSKAAKAAEKNAE